jgi:MoaA/NifB/PqqE/SkfB family radical SAM enzyme
MLSFGNVFRHLKFIKKSPIVFFRIVKDYFYVLVLRKNRLRTIDWAVTYRCNSKCVMCSAKTLMNNKKNANKKEMTPEQISMVWKQAVRLGAIHVNLTGGEPTVRNTKEIEKIIKLLNAEGAIVSMVTNSIFLTKEMLSGFCFAGLNTLQLSLESMDSIEHDSVRGMAGNYFKVMEVLGWAKELGLNICLSAVITANNFDSVKRIIDFGKSENVFVLLNPISSSGKKSGDFKDSIAAKKSEYYKLFNDSNVRADTLFNFRGGSGCPAGVERIYLTPYGEVMTCPHVQVSYGNVLEEPLEKIYNRISNFPYLKKFEKDCRHVWNNEYIEKIMKPTFDTFELPIPIFEHPITKEKDISEYLKESKNG